MQTTTIFAPTARDLEEGYFDIPVITMRPLPVDDEESEQGEP
jgi:hypothetical protein